MRLTHSGLLPFRTGAGICGDQFRPRFLAVLLLAILFACLPCRNAGAEPQTNATVRVAGLVLKWIRTDKEANFRRVEPMVREAARGGARIVVTTECFLDGYAIKDKRIPLADYRALGEPIPDGTYFQRLTALAQELKIHLVAGYKFHVVQGAEPTPVR